jgi:hypothetical protein
MPRKEFEAFTRLDASDVNTFLMDQSVMSFATTAARDAAIATPVAGMMTYLEDFERFELYDGATWAFLTIKGTNTGLGKTALANLTTGTGNTAIGQDALTSLTTNGNCVAVGQLALQNAAANGNTGLGRQAGASITTGGTNTAIGFQAGNTLTTGSNNTILGNGSTTAAATSANSVTLGNSSITSLRCNVTTISSLSDERDKTDITDTQFGINLIEQLRPVDFTWSRRDGSYEGMTDVGFISQELMQVEDSFDAADRLRLTLRENPDSLEATPGRLIPVIVKALQELSAENASLKARLEALEK